jgi:hypothetical protein
MFPCPLYLGEFQTPFPRTLCVFVQDAFAIVYEKLSSNFHQLSGSSIVEMGKTS